MNRPRNRQPRAQQQQQAGRRPAAVGARSTYASTPSDVPTIHQVVHGAQVSIVQKQDQPTGRQVQGTVQDVLTRGNHPRGIKVRLTDGRVGRVHGMATQRVNMQRSQNSVHGQGTAEQEPANLTDQPPARSLADYFPPSLPSDSIRSSGSEDLGAVATCPICNRFQGDEVAVSRHVDTHFT